MANTVRHTKTNITSNNGWLTGSLEYEVLSDSLSGSTLSDVSSVLAINGVPQYGDVIGSSKAKGYVQSVTANRSGSDRVSGRYKWSVTATIANVAKSSSSPTMTNLGYTIARHSEEIERVRAADVNGVLNTNSAGDFFEQGLVQKIPIVVWTFSGKLSSNPESWAQYEKCINSDVMWSTIQPGYLILDGLSYSRSVGESLWDTQIVIKWNPFGWNELRADVGFYYVSNSIKYRFLNEDGSPKETPSLLNGLGGSSAIPVYKEFQNQPSFAMSTLGLASPLS